MSVTASRNNRPATLVLPLLAMGLAVAAALLLIVAGFGSRFGWWHFRTGFTLFTYGAYGGIGTIVLALLAGIPALRIRSARGIVLSSVALLDGLAVVAVPVSWRSPNYLITRC